MMWHKWAVVKENINKTRYISAFLQLYPPLAKEQEIAHKVYALYGVTKEEKILAIYTINEKCYSMN